MQSDSVLPVINPSFPLPPPALTDHTHSKHLEYVTSGSQTSQTTMSELDGDHSEGHRRDFETGAIDTHGRDSFSNIQARIDHVLSQGNSEEQQGSSEEPRCTDEQ